MSEYKSQKSETRIVNTIWISVFLVAVFIGLFLYKRSLFINSTIDSEKWAHFGDFIGGIIGSLWALLGVLLFYIALKEQREDFKTNRETLESQTEALNLQLKEFEQQRQEQIETRKVFQTQQKTLEIQQFEQTFFNLINLHHTIVSTIDLRKTRTNKSSNGKKEADKWVETGRDCFASFFNGIKVRYNRNKSIKDVHQRLKLSFDSYYDDHHADLDSYLRNVHYILRFLEMNSDRIDVDFYADVFRSQLSTYELSVMFYSMFSRNASNSEKLVSEFNLFKNLSKEFLIFESHYELLNKS